MAQIPRPALVQKTELSPQDLKKVMVRDFEPAVTKIFLVSCPWRSYGATTTKVCRTCPWHQGFGPFDLSKPISEDNFRSFCAYPIARQVFKIEV